MKNLFENWRRFMSEDDKTDAQIASAREKSMRKGMNALLEDEPSSEDVKKAINVKLDKEGGAAGLGPLVDAAKKIDPDITEDEVKQMLKAMSNVDQHEEGDYVDKAQLEEAATVYLEAKQVAEGTIQEKDDRCTRLAKQSYDVWPSAYASGAVVKCRQGKIWKDRK